jgi:hypothetical protein
MSRSIEQPGCVAAHCFISIVEPVAPFLVDLAVRGRQGGGVDVVSKSIRASLQVGRHSGDVVVGRVDAAEDGSDVVEVEKDVERFVADVGVVA